MGNLTHYAGSSGGSNGNTPGSPAENPEHGGAADGYASEDFVPGSSSSRERKKGLVFPAVLVPFFFLLLRYAV